MSEEESTLAGPGGDGGRGKVAFSQRQDVLASAASNYTSMTRYWWTLAVPGGALTLTVLGANLWVEGLRKAQLSVAGPGSKQRAS